MIVYKYRSTTQLDYVFDMIFNQRLYCSRLDQLNDPNEAITRFMTFPGKEPNRDRRKEINTFKKDHRVCSLSKVRNNLLLWAHYANGLNGIAVEIELQDDDENIHEVKYVKALPRFNELFNYEDNGPASLLKHKLIDWRYESEVRVIAKKDYYELAIPIRKIYIGSKVTSYTREALEIICKEKDIQTETVTVKGRRVYGISEVPKKVVSSRKKKTVK